MPLADLGEIDKLNRHTIQCIQHNDYQLVLIYSQQQFFLLDNLCPHKAAALCDGELVDDAIQCPWHKAKFDIRSGQGLSPLAAKGVKSYQVSEVDGQLLAELP